MSRLLEILLLLLRRLLLLRDVLISFQEVTAILFVPESHASIFISERIEKLLDRLVLLYVVWSFAKSQKIL